MEQLNDYILDAIITLRQKKKQPNEDLIFNILTSKMESLTKEKLESQLNELIKQQRIYNKPHCGNNSYYVYEQVDNLVPTEKPPPSDTPIKNNFETINSIFSISKSPIKNLISNTTRNTLNRTIKVTKKSTYTTVI